MAIKVLGYASQHAAAKLAPYVFERREPRVDDIVIDILYCGVCHSDLHHVNGDWPSMFPLVPGHEIIGRVVSIGSAVTCFNVGDSVGVGCMVDSCQHCSPCEHGEEQFCEEGATLTYNSLDRHDKMPTFGGYSEKIVVSEKFVLRIPDKMDLRSAAPLLCAGITTWSPLKHWNVGQNSKVAVLGLGGLGHMAIKLAKGLGAQVTLFTRSARKEQDAIRLGADKIVISTDETQMEAVKNHFDLIIDTVPYVHNLNPYVSTLSVNGTLVLVGFLGEMNSFLNTAPMVMGRRSIAGSVIGGIAETQNMLDFCAEHDISPVIEMINIQDIHKAYEDMLASKVKYRFVIDMSSLRK